MESPLAEGGDSCTVKLLVSNTLKSLDLCNHAVWLDVQREHRWQSDDVP